MDEIFPIYQIIEKYDSYEAEMLGTKSKIWVRDKYTQRLWLCKQIRYREDGSPTGEDWAEVVASKLCELIRIPHAKYHFAEWNEKRAVVSRCVLWEYAGQLRDELCVFDEVLKLPYLKETADKRERSKEFFTLEAIAKECQRPDLELLPKRALPNQSIKNAWDVLVGYFMLDAWIGNSDRHEQNLAIIERRNKDRVRRFLSPTFDHASSLGRELTDSSRDALLDSKNGFVK